MSPLRFSQFIVTFMLIFMFVGTSIAQSKGDISLGLLVMVGGRYDNLRMCVATGSGVKGGPIADVMVTGRYAVTDRVGIGINLPVMRPLLFGLAFKMLQFEPEVMVDFRNRINDRVDVVAAPALGVSLHYGPDYRSDRQNRSPSFFAAGPLAGVHVGIGFKDGAGTIRNFLGVKPFYAALFTRDHGIGTVVGGVFEYRRGW
jgi:hypothetical protein